MTERDEVVSEPMHDQQAIVEQVRLCDLSAVDENSGLVVDHGGSS